MDVVLYEIKYILFSITPIYTGAHKHWCILNAIKPKVQVDVRNMNRCYRKNV